MNHVDGNNLFGCSTFGLRTGGEHATLAQAKPLSIIADLI